MEKMTMINNNVSRIYYMREQTINQDRNMSKMDYDNMYHNVHRGAPVAAVITEINREKNIIRYAVSTVHPKDRFDKKMAVHIAKERLNGIDKNNNPKAGRRHGANTITGKEAEHVLSIRNGHEITKLVMRDIFASINIPQRVRNIAAGWLALEAEYDSKKFKVSSAPEKPENVDVFVKDSQRFETVPVKLGYFDRLFFR